MEQGAEIEERDMSKRPLTLSELQALVPEKGYTDYLNPKSALYREKRMRHGPPAYREALSLMAKEPNLIRRPIVIAGRKRVIGFQIDELKKLFKG